MATDQESAFTEPIMLPAGVPFRPDLVWRCGDCGYQRQAPDRPERCPACGAGAEKLDGKTSIEWRLLIRHRPAV